MKEPKRHLQILLKSILILKKLVPGYLILNIALSIFSAVLPYIPIYMSAKIIDNLILHLEIKKIVVYVIITIGTSFTIGIVKEMLSKLILLKGNTLRIKHDLYLNDKLNELSLSQVEDASIQAMKERISENANMFSLGLVKVAGDISYFLNNIFSAIIATILLYDFLFITQIGTSFGEKIGTNLVMIIIIVVSVIVNYIGNVKKMSRIFKSTATLGEANTYRSFYEGQYLEDNGAAKEIRLFNQKKLILNEIIKNSDEKIWIMRKDTFRIQVKASTLMSLVNTLIEGVLYIFVTYKAYMGQISFGDIVLYCGTMNRFVLGVSGVAGALFKIKENTEYLKLFFDYVELKPSIQTNNRSIYSNQEHTIEFKNVSFCYPNTTDKAISDLSISIPWGKKIAVVGENGSGKTTFIKLLCSFYKPSEGSIMLDGYDVFDYKSSEYASLFSVVFQDFKLLSQPVCKNVSANEYYDENKVQEALEKAGIADYIDSLENKINHFLYTKFDDKGIDVSGGEEQKLAIARAVYKDAPYIILDEPTAALDPLSEYEIYQNIHNITDGKTVIFISHRLSSCRLCDKIAVFDKGNLVQFGTHDELITDVLGKYYQLWTAQSQYYDK